MHPATRPCLLSSLPQQKYAAAMRLPTRLRYGLSGTPFQNDYAGGWVGGGLLRAADKRSG